MTTRIEGGNIPISEQGVIGISCETCEAEPARVQLFTTMPLNPSLNEVQKLASRHERDMVQYDSRDHIVAIKIYHKDRPPRLFS